MNASAPTRARPERAELVSLAERMGSLALVRGGMLVAGVLFVGLAPAAVRAPRMELILGFAAFVLPLIAPLWVSRVRRGWARRIVAGSLLVDGVVLAWLTFATGGTQSPLRLLIVLHVVAVTLLASYRTGMKLAAWHSILSFVVLYAQAADVVPAREELVTALPGGPDFPTVAILQVLALWAVGLVTAACAAVNERELRIQKIDLEQLSATVRELSSATAASEIPEKLLDTLGRVFGFTRGAVLTSPRDDLALVATRGVNEPSAPPAPGLDDVMERAWETHRTQLVRRLDPAIDPRLSALLPDAENVLVVPLMVGGYRLGILALEHPARTHKIKRWVVTVVEQFASHAALTLNNAWLRDDLEARLEENRELQAALSAHNLELEVKVEARTRDLTKTLEELRITDEQRRRLLARLVHAEEETRKRIAEDIHDDPVQKMVATSMRLQLMRKGLADPQELAELERLLETVRGSVKGMRNLIFELRPHALDQQGLGAALREYLERLDAEFVFHLDDHLDVEPSPELRVVLYRLAQEALTNIRKHAQAERVDVHLSEQDGGFFVRIADDGVGFSAHLATPSEPGHLGLSSMRERAEMAGGWCRLHSLPGDGTTVEFWVPAGPAATEDIGADEPVITLARVG